MANIDKTGFITALSSNEYIVVGTNEQGMHGGGAARYAADNFGLQDGCGEGLSGQTYALPTMEGILPLYNAADRFKKFAKFNPDKTFYLTKVACGIAGYDEEQIAPLFGDAPDNVIKPEGW